jgi:hypothetical protein
VDQSPRYDTIQPRFLRYRNHYKVYAFVFFLFAFLLWGYWTFNFVHYGWSSLWPDSKLEILFTIAYFLSGLLTYFFWFKPQLKKSIQVFSSHILFHNGAEAQQLNFTDVESVNRVCWSLFYLKTRDNHKFYFNSSIDRLDYLWEGLRAARPDLLSEEDFEAFRLKLIQYDHHQKRKDWFFRHNLLDVFNWFVLPIIFIVGAHIFQSRGVQINFQGMYVFRLIMFSILTLLATSFFYSMILKKLVFDKRIESKVKGQDEKSRDLEFEGVILQRSKIFQIVTACFIFTVLVWQDLNLYSVTKIKEDVASFGLKKGSTVVVDNRFNCTRCKYQVHDGDLLVFGKGYIGQVMARGGDFVGEVSSDRSGRNIASDNVQEVPAGHVAVKVANGEIAFIKLTEITGKIRN